MLTRGSVVAEQTPGGFTGVYKVLAAAEDAGRIRRGYFIEQLGAAQFTASATIDRLRDISERLDDERLEDRSLEGAHRDSMVVLAAADPANPYGAALDWPAPPSTPQPGQDAKQAPSSSSTTEIWCSTWSAAAGPCCCSLTRKP